MQIISKDEIKEAGQIFDWAYREHYQLWFTGGTERSKRFEVMLPRLVRTRGLVAQQIGKKFAYAAPRKKNKPVMHGLGVTETIVRILRSDQDGEFIEERFFKGFGSVPDWGVKYGEKLLLVEFSTKDNFEGARIIKTKLTKYEQNLEKIITHFKAQSAIVLFVLDVSRERVINFIKRTEPEDVFFFTDFETFKTVPFGQQLLAPIYLWSDGEAYRLKND